MRQQALRLLRIAGAGLHQSSIATETTTLAVSTPLRALSNLSTSYKSSSEYVFAAKAGFNTSAAPRMAVAIDGDLQATLSQIDAILSNENVTAKEVSDAAVALAYLQAKDDRRIWGKVFERASAVKGSFDASSLASFLWAATTAGVDHFKTVAELSGPAASLLSTLSPTQISIVVEALGKSCVKDADLYNAIGAKVTQDIAKFKPSELSRLLWGFAHAHHEDGALAKTLSKALADKAGDLSGKEAIQAIWGLAKLRRTDKATLDVLVKAAKGKLGSLESTSDAAALAWSLGFLNYKDAAVTSALAASLKSGAGDLSTAQAIDAAWGLSILGDKEGTAALLTAASSAVQKDPTSVDVYHLGALYNAAVISGSKIPDQVKAYSLKMYNLGGESLALKRSAAASVFVKDLSESVAKALGAKYRPEVTKAVKGYSSATAEGVSVDIAASVDGVKFAVEPVFPGYLSATHAGVILGPAAARAALLEAAGFKVVSIPHTDFVAAGSDAKAQVTFVLNAIKAAGGKVSA